MDRSPAAGSAPRLVVRVRGSDRSLQPGPAYLLGRDQDCHIVVADNRVSRRHAEFRIEGTTWVLADRGSTNGIFAGGQRIGRLEITGDCVVRLGHPVHGLELSCALDIEPAQPAPSQDSPAIRLVAWPAPPAPPVFRQLRPPPGLRAEACARSRMRSGGWHRRASGSRTSTSLTTTTASWTTSTASGTSTRSAYRPRSGGWSSSPIPACSTRSPRTRNDSASGSRRSTSSTSSRTHAAASR